MWGLGFFSTNPPNDQVDPVNQCQPFYRIAIPYLGLSCPRMVLNTRPAHLMKTNMQVNNQILRENNLGWNVLVWETTLKFNNQLSLSLCVYIYILYYKSLTTSLKTRN